jgi:hypothetical protein
MASFNPMRTGHSLFRLVSILFDLAQDVLRLLLLGTRSSAALKAENIFLRKQLALYLGARGQTATGYGRYPLVHGFVLSALPMAERFGQRQARDFPRLASKRLSSTLAMEVEATREAARAY